MNSLQQQLFRFLQQHGNRKKPVLVAVSGGVDSMALLNAFISLDCCPIHVAHVDHGWRDDSTHHAEELRRYVEGQQLPFHTIRLDPSKYKGNREAAARDERLTFLEMTHRKIDAQAVVLGHHSGDQGETVLKRVLQGNALPFLAAMTEVSFWRECPLWRPWLHVSKEKLIAYCKNNNVPVWEDSTNNDPQFLRTRMRQTIVPELEKAFGKRIEQPLARLSDEAMLLREYLDRKIAPILDQMSVGPFGYYLALTKEQRKEFIELQHCVRTVGRHAGVIVPHHMVKAITTMLQDGASDKKMEVGGISFYPDRGRLFVVIRPLISAGGREMVTEKEHCFDGWKIQINNEGNEDPSIDSVAALWRGEVFCSGIEMPVQIGYPQPGARYREGQLLKDWWSQHKVPAFLRMAVPVLYRGDDVVHEFLSATLSLRISGTPSVCN